jgi:hypothetical protein
MENPNIRMVEITGPDQDYIDFYKPMWDIYNSIPKTPFEPIPEYIFEKEKFELVDIYWSLYRLWHNRIKHWYYDLKYIWINLKTYSPIILHNRDWDQSFLLTLLLAKMKRMQGSCREHTMEGPHNAALDRCVVILEELIKRDNCNCNYLHDVGQPNPVDKLLRERCVACYNTQKELYQEFGKLFGEFCSHWWD